MAAEVAAEATAGFPVTSLAASCIMVEVVGGGVPTDPPIPPPTPAACCWEDALNTSKKPSVNVFHSSFTNGTLNKSPKAGFGVVGWLATPEGAAPDKILELTVSEIIKKF